MGDRRWQDIIQSYYTAVYAELARFRGNEINTAGDGVLAAFPRSSGVKCPLLAQSGHLAIEFQCPLLGVQPTLPIYGRKLGISQKPTE